MEADESEPADAHILGYFRQIGMREPLTFSEVSKWAELTGTHVTPFIAETLVSMSAAFHNYRAISVDPAYPHPWQSREEAMSIASAKAFDAL